MRCDLVEPGEPRWADALEHIRHDIYHLPGYTRFSTQHEEPGRGVAFVAEDAGSWFTVPLIVREVPPALAGNSGAYDAISPKLYPGPIASIDPAADGEAFLGRAVAGLREALAGDGVLSAFIRMHPLLTPDASAFRTAGRVVDHGDSVSIDLTLDDAELWHRTRANHRRDINKARRAGYRFRVDLEWRRLDEFAAIYAETMERLDAAPAWRLSREYFVALREHVGGHMVLGVVELDGALACGALLSEVGDLVAYHLSGTAESHMHARPSKLLIHEATAWAKARGARTFHLGGSLRRGDDLEHFKLGFSPLVHPVCSWRVVIDEARYAALAHRWRERHRVEPDPDDAFFPSYRKPAPVTSAP